MFNCVVYVYYHYMSTVEQIVFMLSVLFGLFLMIAGFYTVADWLVNWRTYGEEKDSDYD